MIDIKIDLVLLTYERVDVTMRTLRHNLKNAGYPISNVIHVDNSEKENLTSPVQSIAAEFKVPLIQCDFPNNTGVARGYNTAISLSRNPWLTITGCDFEMPKNWLRTYAEYIEALPETGFACMLHKPIHYPDMQPLKTGPPQTINGKKVEPCLMFSRRIMRRELFTKAGYFREDLGAEYGSEDNEHHQRTHRLCKSTGLIGYNIPGQIPFDADTKKEMEQYKEYWKWKKECVKKCGPKFWEVVKQGCPYYTPF